MTGTPLKVRLIKYAGVSLIGAVLQNCPAPLNWNIQRISLDTFTANLLEFLKNRL